MHNKITMTARDWERIHALMVAEFPREKGRKVKALSDKWEKLRTRYYKMKKTNTSGTRTPTWSWYADIDEILSFTAKANGVPGGMDQGEFVSGSAAAPVILDSEGEDEGGGGDPTSP